MEGDLQTQVARPSGQPTQGQHPEVSASEQAQAPRVDMNDVLRQAAGFEPASKPDAPSASEDDAGQDEGSAPSMTSDADGASKPSGQPGVSRRGAAQRLAALEAENQRLQQTLAQLNPPPPDPDEQRRERYRRDEARFRALVPLPDDDPTLAQGDNWAWLQEEKRKRAVAPELSQHYETVLADERQRLYAEAQARDQAMLGHIRSQVASTLDLPGIEPTERETLRTTQSWLDHVLIQRAAAERVTAARFSDELARLRKENEQLKRETFGRARAPADGGRPTSGPGRPDMNEVMRQIAGVTPR